MSWSLLASVGAALVAGALLPRASGRTLGRLRSARSAPRLTAGGRPPWRQETIWTPLLKGFFGIVICIGLYWVAHKFLYGTRLDFAVKLGAPDKPIPDGPVVLGPMIGAVWGALVELDDSAGSGTTSDSAISKR